MKAGAASYKRQAAARAGCRWVSWNDVLHTILNSIHIYDCSHK